MEHNLYYVSDLTGVMLKSAGLITDFLVSPVAQKHLFQFPLPFVATAHITNGV